MFALKLLILGFVLGTWVAVMGAWKDTLFEPFEIRKFFRSPLIVAAWAFILGLICHGQSFVLIALAAISLERLSVESWKALIRKPPSKFARETKDRGWLLDRLGPDSNAKTVW